MTPTSKLYLSSLKVPVGSNHTTCAGTGGILDNNDDGDNDDNNNYNVEDNDNNDCDNDNNDRDNDNNDDRGLDVDSAPDHDVNQLQLAESFEVPGDPTLDWWFSEIKRDPLKCTWKLVKFLHSSDQRKDALHDHITIGNESNWFIRQDDKGKCIVLKVPQLELLKDVKMRWDLVYLMLERFWQLRPVGFSQQSDVRDSLNI